ncbi:MAG: hypothetical protein E3K37_02795 [Candidatus Kuenenia sp.]|nr:hypothetical protein [Candidatus Kuenenia hertensis]
MNNALSVSSKSQMLLRGATEEEVEITVRTGTREPAKLGRFKSRHSFVFNSFSPVNQKFYKYKTVESIFADEPEKITIVTVKVYFTNSEVTQ